MTIIFPITISIFINEAILFFDFFHVKFHFSKVLIHLLKAIFLDENLKKFLSSPSFFHIFSITPHFPIVFVHPLLNYSRFKKEPDLALKAMILIFKLLNFPHHLSIQQNLLIHFHLFIDYLH
jgi:hypothetical protein